MLRSLGAVVAGYVVFAASAGMLFQLSGHAPHGAVPLTFKIASIAAGVVFALIGGWAAASLAGRRPRAHAAAVAVLIALGALISLATSGAQETWSQVAAIAVMAPAAWLGGRFRRERPVS